MKNPMEVSRTHRSESGFALIEVIVSAAVLAIVALAVLSGIDAANGASAREKARAVAASLAEQDQERLRTLPISTIGNPPQQDDVTVDGVTYKIQSDSEWITDDVGGTPECGEESNQVEYVHITTTVTSAIVGKAIKPVTVDSLVAPTTRWAEGHGTLGVKVVDRSATKGVRNIAVSVTSPAYTPPTESTDVNGCVVFKSVPIGTYTITLNTTGYLDRNGDQVSEISQTVVAKKVSFATMTYDEADSVTVNVKTHRPGTTWSTANSRDSKARSVSATNGANVGLLETFTPSSAASQVTADGLFPFAENSYTFFTGACKYASPDKVYNTNYFSSTGGVNPGAAVLADPAVLSQTAAVRQPPFNIRVLSTRSGAAFSDANMKVFATLVKPSAFSTDSCTEARYELATMTNDWTGTTHWVSQRGSTFDPGMPFGEYTLCLRDTNLVRGANVTGTYDNRSPDGGASLSINGNSLSWASGTCNY
jgi:type II secretory pathway pseudopilin PulG